MQATAQTSHAAAESMRPHTETMRRQVCQFIANAAANGCTDEEVQIGLGMNPSTERPRRGEAWAYGMLTDSPGERRPTASGRTAVVWFITDVGVRALGLPDGSWCVRTVA